MVTGHTLLRGELEERIEDILTMYAAGVVSRMEEDYSRGLGWAHRAEQAALQFGLAARSDGDVCFGISRLDKAYAQGRAKAAAACKVYNLNGEELGLGGRVA